MTRRWLWPNSSILVLWCCLSLSLAGCGKKGPPKPPLRKELPKVKNLQAIVADTGIKLTWTLPSSGHGTATFEVYRSRVEPEASQCPECRTDFEIISTVKVRAGETRFQVLDPLSENKGTFYYKVTPMDNKNRPGPDSNESMVVIE
jgi:predicted small lipoprotein YifL